MLRTHTCGELRTDHVGQTVTLAGWVIRGRDHGGLAFIDLRDRYGVTQIVFNPDRDTTMHELSRSLRAEDVIQVTGEVVLREDRENEKLATGKIEIRAHQLKVLNKSKTPPFEPGTSELPNEELRLTYRFIDLRSERLQEALKLRHRLSKLTRDYFDQLQFLEIETPILGRSTPEGARDYLVPSRVHEACFYALPQSPQIYKQILMISGYDRYFQIARCFRDEDLRADRQPEFTQIDLEMAFVDQEDILTVVDGLIETLLKDLRNEQVALPLPRYDYHDVMEKYGSDKPDLRFGLELIDIGEIAASCDFAVFKKTIESGGRVRGLNAKGAADRYSRKDIDGLTEFVGDFGAKGLAFFKVTDEGLHSPIAKFFSDADKQKIMDIMGAEVGDLLFFVADQCSVTSAALSALRNRLGKELQLYDPKDFKCCWVLNFPLLSYNEEEKRWDAE
ncbi:MAG: aspartate--tRNA ligase, partial [Planctomycetota bacterium]